MSKNVHRVLIFIPEADQARANDLAATFDPGDGSDTFRTVRLSPSGKKPVTHYACDTRMTQERVDQLPTIRDIHQTWNYRLDMEFEQAMSEVGLTRITQ